MNVEATLALTARLCLGLVFVSSGLGKLFNQRRFYDAVLRYQILPVRSAWSFSAILPWIELICGVMVIAGILLGSSALILACLLASFAIAVLVNLRRRRILDCNCYGVLDTGRINEGTVVRIAMLGLLAGFLVWRYPPFAFGVGLQILFSIDTGIPVALLVLSYLIMIRMIEEAIRVMRYKTQFDSSD